MLAKDISHPAKYSKEVLNVLEDFIRPNWRVLDPFAGVGTLAKIDNCNQVVFNELEIEWAKQCKRGNAVVSNTLYLPFGDRVFDAVITSPVYGNRMADHHQAKDNSRRITYRHALGRELHPANAGGLQWGASYRNFHEKAWKEVHRVLRPSGIFILNVSDHIRKGAVVPVSLWHQMTVESLHFWMIDDVHVPTQRMRFGQNGAARVGYEHVYVFEKVEDVY